MKTETLDAISTTAGKVTVFGAAGSAVLTFVVSNFAGLMGVLIALIGLLVNLYYKRKADRRRDLELQHDMRMKENADRRFEEWQRFRMQAARDGVHVPPITDFGALAHASGPWTAKNKPEEDDDGG